METKVFEQTYADYMERLAKTDYISRASILGADSSGDELLIPFYGKHYRISSNGVYHSSGKRAHFAQSVVLCCYILQCPDEVHKDGNWVTYREFKDAGPLINYFTANTNKIIETGFTGNIAKLKMAGEKLGGVAFNDGSSHDISLKFDVLPRIPVLLRFNEKDEEFPAQCSILFKQSAEKYIDMECLAIAGTFLAGKLIGKKR